jgi:hypothetical protein
MNKSLRAFLVVVVLLVGILVLLVASRLMSKNDRDAAALFEQLSSRTPVSPCDKELARTLLTASRRPRSGSFEALRSSDSPDAGKLVAEITAGLDNLTRVFQVDGLCDKVFRLGDGAARKLDAVASMNRKLGYQATSDSMGRWGRTLRRWLDNGRSIYRVQTLGGRLNLNGVVVRKVRKLPTFKFFQDVYPFKEQNGRVSVCSGIDSVVVSADSDTVTIHCRTVFYKK